MIYGYAKHPLGDEMCHELREVSVAMPPEMLRRLAEFILEAADTMEADENLQVGWHMHARDHVPEWWEKSGGHDFIACAPSGAPLLQKWEEIPLDSGNE